MDETRKAVLSELAAMLSAAWHKAGKPVTVDARFYPRDRAEAYFVQDLMHEKLGQGLAGWKVGATSQKMRDLDGHDDVIPGRIFASRSYVGARHSLLIDLFAGARAETEFAFRLTATPHLRTAPWTAEEMESMMILHPAIEIIGNRYRLDGASKAENSLMTIADNGGGMGFVFGDPVDDWQDIDFQQHMITLTVSGGTPAENFLGEMRCRPSQAAADLVNHLAARGHMLEAGDFISTGAASVPQPFAAGDRVHADFGALGVMELAF
jgi:2-keto-4-pentenoate hydratase